MAGVENRKETLQNMNEWWKLEYWDFFGTRNNKAYRKSGLENCNFKSAGGFCEVLGLKFPISRNLDPKIFTTFWDFEIRVL